MRGAAGAAGTRPGQGGACLGTLLCCPGVPRSRSKWRVLISPAEKVVVVVCLTRIWQGGLGRASVFTCVLCAAHVACVCVCALRVCGRAVPHRTPCKGSCSTPLVRFTDLSEWTPLGRPALRGRSSRRVLWRTRLRVPGGWAGSTHPGAFGAGAGRGVGLSVAGLLSASQRGTEGRDKR